MTFISLSDVGILSINVVVHSAENEEKSTDDRLESRRDVVGAESAVPEPQGFVVPVRLWKGGGEREDGKEEADCLNCHAGVRETL